MMRMWTLLFIVPALLGCLGAAEQPFLSGDHHEPRRLDDSLPSEDEELFEIAEPSEIPLSQQKDQSATNPLVSPKGVRMIQIFPGVEFQHDRYIDSCDPLMYSTTSIVNDPVFLQHSGLQNLAREVYNKYAELMLKHNKTLQYHHKRALANPVLVANEYLVDCLARFMLAGETSLTAATCQCASSQDSAKFCEDKTVWAGKVHCHSDVLGKLDKAKHCPVLLRRDRGVQLSKMCSGWVAGIVSSLDLDLFNLAFPDVVPAVVKEKSIRQEARAYYLAYKLLEKFTRYSVGYVNCPSLDDKGTLKDFQMLPTWFPKMYIYTHDEDYGKVPLAVLGWRYDSKDSNFGAIQNFVIVIRDALTTLEGRLVEQSNFALRYLSGGQGAVHDGYATIATLMLSPIQSYLGEYFSQLQNSTFPRVTVVGGGLFGSGVASVLASLLSQTVIETSTSKVVYNAILFGGGAVGDALFTDAFAKKINVRNIVTNYEGEAERPCGTVKSCPSKDFWINTGDKDERYSYVPLPGKVAVDLEDLEHEMWRSPSRAFEVVTNKVCAPICWLATKFCPDEPNPRCTPDTCSSVFTGRKAVISKTRS